MSEKKGPTFKGQSRITKQCHWCSKAQEPGKPAFQACARCKEVIYCAACKASVAARKMAAEEPGLGQATARLKRWHGSHTVSLRHAAVCALDLVNTPSEADTKALFIEVALRPDHTKLPSNGKYEVVEGFELTMDELHEILSSQPTGKAIIEGGIAGHEHMKAKGSLGVVTILIKAGEVVDVVRVTLPSQQGAREMLVANGDWRKDWVRFWHGCAVIHCLTYFAGWVTKDGVVHEPGQLTHRPYGSSTG
ncbi:hypothetical protein PLICRDRAFT_102961 [Plicaturopsis crispa FD-325 SS-3]|nr:hypothetical protein PLICRDRAFT_102961 [Plicaturopsis crispa FD-325 SS-3]